MFGPVLHVLRFRRADLGRLIESINATGYGLTFGVHSRIDETIDFVTALIRAGNLYVNRNMVGAVVGVQPFGGAACPAPVRRPAGPGLCIGCAATRAHPRCRSPMVPLRRRRSPRCGPGPRPADAASSPIAVRRWRGPRH